MTATDWRAEAEELRRRAPHHILFLCVANSARSQKAEGIARSLAADRGIPAHPWVVSHERLPVSPSPAQGARGTL